MKKYKNVQELFKDLPDTVLLVGNGKLDNKGELIDSYDFVIRFNDFELDGYEKDNGSKVDAISLHCSDFTFSHTKSMEKNYQRYRETSYIFTTSPRFTHSKNDILHPHSDYQLISVYRPIQFKPELRLSSGTSLVLNLSLFFNKNVHLIGFDFMNSGHYWDPNFSNAKFWEKMGNKIPAHDPNFEKNLISKLNSVTLL